MLSEHDSRIGSSLVVDSSPEESSCDVERMEGIEAMAMSLPKVPEKVLIEMLQTPVASCWICKKKFGKEGILAMTCCHRRCHEACLTSAMSSGRPRRGTRGAPPCPCCKKQCEKIVTLGENYNVEGIWSHGSTKPSLKTVTFAPSSAEKEATLGLQQLATQMVENPSDTNNKEVEIPVDNDVVPSQVGDNTLLVDTDEDEEDVETKAADRHVTLTTNRELERRNQQRAVVDNRRPSLIDHGPPTLPQGVLVLPRKTPTGRLPDVGLVETFEV